MEYFTKKSYENFLKHLVDNKFNIITFSRWKVTGEDGIILRHDVDYEIKPAYDMAITEKSYGIKSTYFLRVTSEQYNVLSHINRIPLKEMSDIGFEIGLHFNPLMYEKNWNEWAKFESSILESVVEQKIRALSLHNPGVTGLEHNFPSFINTYDGFSGYHSRNYFSDSSRDFRGKNPFKFVEKSRKNTIQMVFHPLYWRK